MLCEVTREIEGQNVDMSLDLPTVCRQGVGRHKVREGTLDDGRGRR